ncbi:Ig-like domain-containing protein [Thermus thermophilus]|uniref:Ig-like domain-containing protein n=1 Tax=Thermus thermophilus TaxID=274 RepID=UPI001FCC47EA|nr:Ig-like domain-containing protein [Thermus thermophilus]
MALLLGGCNLSGEGSTGQGTVNLSVGISKPTAGAHTNQRDVEVRIAATGGRVESAKLAYTGSSSGEIPLTPSGGVWRGTLPESLSSGTYTLKAEARVGSFIKESGPVVFVFDKDKPQITILAPTSPVTLSSASLEVRVQVQDAHSGIKSVKLFAENILLEEKPGGSGEGYVFKVNRDTLPEGTVALRVVAEDLAGNTQEATVPVKVDRTPPTVVWKAPADGAVVSGAVALEVEATDNVGVAKVEFFAGSTKLGEATSAPFTFNWNTLGYPDGPVTLKARAVDAAGNAAEATLTVTVANAPRISWLNPTPNQQVAGLVTLQVEVQALRSVERVEFYFGPDETQMSKIPGTPSQSGSTYTLDWNVLQVAPGDYLLKAKVVDAQGSEAEALIPVKVGSTFVITTPAEGEEVGPGAQKEIVAVTIGINGTLPPGVNVSKVEIYINGQYVGDALNATAGDGSQIFIYTWDTTQLAPGHDPTLSGDRVITARVYYTGGDTWTNGVRVSYQP